MKVLQMPNHMLLPGTDTMADQESRRWISEDLAECEATAVHGKIELVPMAQRSEVQDRAEDWTGKSSTALRRKLQNRLNQRASRKRKKQISTPAQVFVPNTRTEKQSDLIHHINPDSLTHSLFQSASKTSTSFVCTARIPLTGSAPLLASFLSTPLPVDQKLMTLLHFNLVRALLENVYILGLDPILMEDDIPSPFLACNHDVVTLIERLPPALKPTALQLTVPHHPELDGFPYPELRDNFIRAGEGFDADAFCVDMLFGVDTSAYETSVDADGNVRREENRSGRTGLIVWSDPWLSGSWEVEEGFARKWGWLLKGCEEIVQSTNFWRASRGEVPLRFEEVED
ncbi:hypothetical protein VTL71DRAFT_9035 [Oculimacula yallundae]|uniref:Uncharacterized protein n=1 Tax=Oculimacula yallundae TaxID=86028 RepID=A0ABR4BW85_9HELO